jgi:hypothetical protein
MRQRVDYGPTANLDVLEKGKISFTFLESNYDFSISQPVALVFLGCPTSDFSISRLVNQLQQYFSIVHPMEAVFFGFLASSTGIPLFFNQHHQFFSVV